MVQFSVYQVQTNASWEHSLAARVFYISLLFSNVRRVLSQYNAIHGSLFVESNGQEDLKLYVKRMAGKVIFFDLVVDRVISIIALLVLHLHLFGLDKLKTGPRPTLFSGELINGY